MSNGRIILLLCFTMQLASCNFTNVVKNESPESPVADSNLVDYIQNVPNEHLGGPFIREGVLAIEEGDYPRAQKSFSRALKYDPSNANLHFLNGLSYHLLASNGDSSQLPFAGTGYQLALEYDSSHYWAAYQLGHIKFDQQNYLDAQEAFSYALLLEPNNLELLNALAASSYYAQDIKTARNAIDRAMIIDPQNPIMLRNAIMIYSAANQINDAEFALSQYRNAILDAKDIRVERLSKRVNSWRDFHVRHANLQIADAADILDSGDSYDDSSDDDSNSDSSNNSDSNSDSSNNDDSNNVDNTVSKADSTPLPPLPKMALIDVVIIRSEERIATSKGVNLLNGLTATLGGTTIDYNQALTSGTAAAKTRATTLTYNPTLSIAATYSLNILNDNNDHNEVMARPRLVAMDGEESEFFTGAVFHVELTGAAGSEGSVEDVPVGIKLGVTPNFINDETVQLNINAERAFIESRSEQVGFNNFSQTTKTTVNANVVMQFGDTLILSGLSEKEEENLRDGVPILQDIPGIQYFFSDEDTLEFQKSVLILVTPRKARYTYEDGTQKVDPNQAKETPQPSLDELNSRVDYFKPADNLDAVFHHLKDYKFYREFRTGDVKLETWYTKYGLERRIKRAIDFLYF